MILNAGRYGAIISTILGLCVIIFGLVVRLRLLSWIKCLLVMSIIAGILTRYEYVGLLIAALFSTVIIGWWSIHLSFDRFRPCCCIYRKGFSLSDIVIWFLRFLFKDRMTPEAAIPSGT